MGTTCRKGNHTNQGVDEIVTHSRVAVETDDEKLSDVRKRYSMYDLEYYAVSYNP